MWRTVVGVHSLGCQSAYVHIGPSREAFFDCQRLMSDALTGGCQESRHDQPCVTTVLYVPP
jgi:hypothetical protein